MEILKRARGHQSGEGVSFIESAENVKEEAIRRSTKAGITNSDGTPIRTSAGKGDVPRSCNMDKYRENYVKAFGHN